MWATAQSAILPKVSSANLGRPFARVGGTPLQCGRPMESVLEEEAGAGWPAVQAEARIGKNC